MLSAYLAWLSKPLPTQHQKEFSGVLYTLCVPDCKGKK